MYTLFSPSEVNRFRIERIIDPVDPSREHRSHPREKLQLRPRGGRKSPSLARPDVAVLARRCTEKVVAQLLVPVLVQASAQTRLHARHCSYLPSGHGPPWSRPAEPLALGKPPVKETNWGSHRTNHSRREARGQGVFGSHFFIFFTGSVIHE